MSRRSWTIGSIAALLITGPAAAQSPGTVEVGGFGQWTWFDDNAGRVNANPEDGFGYGGRLGVFLTRKWQVEADGYYSPQDRERNERFCCLGLDPSQVNASAFALRLNYNIPVGARSQFILGAGAVRTKYSFEGGNAPDSALSNYGASGLAGLRFGLTERFAIRLDGVADYMPNAEPEANLNLHARAGLSLMLGRAARRMEAPAPVQLPPPPPRQQPAQQQPPPPPPPQQPPPPRPVVVDTSAITAPIYFDFDGVAIRSDAAATLDRKVAWLRANPGLRIRIEGNADNRDSNAYNLALGQRRARSAMEYLVSRGLAADRFDIVSHGEERPACAQASMTAECHQLNRRADFRIVTLGPDGRIRTP